MSEFYYPNKPTYFFLSLSLLKVNIVSLVAQCKDVKKNKFQWKLQVMSLNEKNDNSVGDRNDIYFIAHVHDHYVNIGLDKTELRGCLSINTKLAGQTAGEFRNLTREVLREMTSTRKESVMKNINKTKKKKPKYTPLTPEERQKRIDNVMEQNLTEEQMVDYQDYLANKQNVASTQHLRRSQTATYRETEKQINRLLIETIQDVATDDEESDKESVRSGKKYQHLTESDLIDYAKPPENDPSRDFDTLMKSDLWSEPPTRLEMDALEKDETKLLAEFLETKTIVGMWKDKEALWVPDSFHERTKMINRIFQQYLEGRKKDFAMYDAEIEAIEARKSNKHKTFDKAFITKQVVAFRKMLRVEAYLTFFDSIVGLRFIKKVGAVPSHFLAKLNPDTLPKDIKIEDVAVATDWVEENFDPLFVQFVLKKNMTMVS